MFYLVCASTDRSSVRVACPGPVEAQAKVSELEETRIGKVRVFDGAGNRVELEQLRSLVEGLTRLGERDLGETGLDERGLGESVGVETEQRAG